VLQTWRRSLEEIHSQEGGCEKNDDQACHLADGRRPRRCPQRPDALQYLSS
jgi:hypothetical protein